MNIKSSYLVESTAQHLPTEIIYFLKDKAIYDAKKFHLIGSDPLKVDSQLTVKSYLLKHCPGTLFDNELSLKDSFKKLKKPEVLKIFHRISGFGGKLTSDLNAEEIISLKFLRALLQENSCIVLMGIDEIVGKKLRQDMMDILFQLESMPFQAVFICTNHFENWKKICHYRLCFNQEGHLLESLKNGQFKSDEKDGNSSEQKDSKNLAS
jgi:hypothetical protein